MQYLTMSTIFILLTRDHVGECCRNSKSGKCCFNFYENMRGQCLECPLGRIGTNCSGQCPLGYFGKLCKEECNCAIRYCNNIQGCLIQPDTTTALSSEAKFIMTGSPANAQKVTATSWNNLTFTFIGCLGTLVIVGAMCFIKSWFFEMKFRTRGIQFEPSVFYRAGNANISNIPNIENMVNEKQEEGHTATNYPGLALRNKAGCDDAYLDPQTSNIYDDLNPSLLYTKNKAGQNGVFSRGSSIKEIVEHHNSDRFQSDGAENIYSRIMLEDRDDSDDDDDGGFHNDKNKDHEYQQPWSQFRNYDGDTKNNESIEEKEEVCKKEIRESCKCKYSFNEKEYSIEQSTSAHSVYEAEFIRSTPDCTTDYMSINLETTEENNIEDYSGEHEALKKKLVKNGPVA